MPQVIAPMILSAWGAVATSMPLWAPAAAGYAAQAITIAGAAAYSSAQQRKLKKAIGESMAQAAIDQGRAVMVRDPISPWRLIYGQIPVSGPIFFWELSGANNEYLNIGVVLAHHECEALDTIKFDGTEVPLDGSGNATGTYAGYVRIKKFLGIAAGERDLTWEAELPGIWTASMVGKNVARLHIQLKHNPDLFVNGLPTVTCMAKGKKVYDFRTATVVWSNDAALCIADFLMEQQFGKGVSLARIRAAEAIEAANICDEDVVLADASTEKRYTIDGAITSDQDPDGVLADLAAAMAGHVSDPGGLWTIRAGAWRTPTLTLGDGDLCGGIKILPRQSRQDTYNGVKGTFIGEINQWTPADFPATVRAVTAPNITAGARVTILSVGSTDFTLIGAASNTVGVTFVATGAGTGTGRVDQYLGEDGGKRLWKDVVYNFTTSPSRCQRLAKIDLEAGRQQIVVTGEYMLKAMQCEPGDVIGIERARMTWSPAKYFEVDRWDFLIEQRNGGPALSVLLVGRETAEAIYDWPDGNELTVDLAPNTTMGSARTVPAVSNFAAAAAGAGELTAQPRVKLSWDAPADAAVLKTETQYKKSADSDWLDWSSLSAATLFDYVTDLEGAASHDFRARHVNEHGVRGAWCTPETIASAPEGQPVPTLLGEASAIDSFSTGSYAASSGLSVPFNSPDGNTRRVTLSGNVEPDNTGRSLFLRLLRDGTPVGVVFQMYVPGGAADISALTVVFSDTPGAGSFTYSIEGKRGAAGVVATELEMFVE